MSDPINKSQAMLVVKEELSIPSDAEQKASIRRLWLTCIVAAVGVFLITGGVVLTLFLMGYDSKKVVEVSTAIFQVLMLSYGMGFFVPALITSLRTMMLGVRMSRKGLEIGEQTAGVIDRVDKAIEQRIRRVDELIAKVEEFAAKAESGILPPAVLKWVEETKTFVHEELEKLRDEIQGARGSTETALSDALDQGEIEAAAATGGKPELEARFPHGPGYPCPCNDGNICQEGICPCGGVCHGHGACGCSAMCNCVQCACPYCKAAIQRFFEQKSPHKGAQAH
jgi:hypothetical protein